MEDNLSQNSIRKHVDSLISQLASSPSDALEMAKTSENHQNIVRNQENTSKSNQNVAKTAQNFSSSSDDEDLFPNEIVYNPEIRRTHALKRRAPNIDNEIEQHIDYAHLGRSKFDKRLQPKDIYDILLADE